MKIPVVFLLLSLHLQIIPFNTCPTTKKADGEICTSDNEYQGGFCVTYDSACETMNQETVYINKLLSLHYTTTMCPPNPSRCYHATLKQNGDSCSTDTECQGGMCVIFGPICVEVIQSVTEFGGNVTTEIVLPCPSPYHCSCPTCIIPF